jgi:hypothetical protein
VLYGILKSLIRSGIAGTNIVSAYITIVAIELRMATTIHAERGMSFPEDGVDDCNVGLSLVGYYYIVFAAKIQKLS